MEYHTYFINLIQISLLKTTLLIFYDLLGRFNLFLSTLFIQCSCFNSNDDNSFLSRKMDAMDRLARCIIGRIVIDIVQLLAAFLLYNNWNVYDSVWEKILFYTFIWINVSLFLLGQRETEFLELLGFKKSLNWDISPGYYILMLYKEVLYVVTFPLLFLGGFIQWFIFVGVI